MNCQECRDYIDPYFDSELDTGNAIRVKQHLRDCPECRERLQSREALRGLLGSPALNFEISETLREKLTSRFRPLATSVRERSVRRFTAPWIFVPLALAAGITLLFGLVLLNKNGRFEHL